MKVNQYKCNPGKEAELCKYKVHDNKTPGEVPCERMKGRILITSIWGGSYCSLCFEHLILAGFGSSFLQTHTIPV